MEVATRGTIGVDVRFVTTEGTGVAIQGLVGLVTNVGTGVPGP